MKIYVGYDPLEEAAVRALGRSIEAHAGPEEPQVELLVEDDLRARGLYTRLTDKRGQKYDLISNAPCSTEFSTSRFLTPILCQQGWALFMDCDMVFMADPTEILEYADPTKAVMVVKHKHEGAEGEKMGGMVQTQYNRKNWSSVMLFNCDHPANSRLSLFDVNNRPGRDLHQFYWLADDEIGELPPEWNWLVGVQPCPDSPKIAHFTLGGPWLPNWEPQQFDNLWNLYSD